jgi:DNA-binding LytR/AlgR family response regulator
VIQEKPEVAVMDIDMPGLSGLEIAEAIRQRHPDCEILFVTSHNEYTRDAFSVYAFDYIEKPVDPARFFKTLDRLRKKYGLLGRRLELPCGRETLMLAMDKILAVEAEGRKTLVHTEEGSHTCNLGLGEMEALLTDARFFKSSRSYILNLMAVTAVQPEGRTSYRVQLRGSHCAYLSRRHYDIFRDRLKALYP